MKYLANKLIHLLSKIGVRVGKVLDKLDSTDPKIILPFRGYANKNQIYMKGRVLEDENIYKGYSNSRIRNLINSYKRFETDEVPNADVHITCNRQSFTCKTDTEGYFILDSTWSAPPRTDQHTWLPVDIDLLSPMAEDGSEIVA